MRIARFGKRIIAVVLGALMALSLCVSITACKPDDSSKTEYTVTFNANGGTLTGNSTVVVKKDAKITGAPTATKTGYVFEGWYTAAENGEAISLETYVVTKDVTLYAHYNGSSSSQTVTVTLNANGGTITGSTTLTVAKGESVSAANMPKATKSEANFIGWFTAAEGGERIELNTHAFLDNTTVYAQYGEVDSMPMKNLTDKDGAAVGYRIEAEEAVTTGTPTQSKPSFIEENIPTASGNKDLGYLGTAGNAVTLTFSAPYAGKANISILGSSNNTKMDFTNGFLMWVDDQVVTGEDMGVTLNGTEINFEPANLRGAGIDMPSVWNAYYDPIDLGELDVLTGYNVLVITVKKQTVPNLDCLDIQTDIALTSADGTNPSGTAVLPEPPAPPADAVVYDGEVSVDLVVGGYEGGPAIEKAIINFKSHEIAKDAIAANPLTVSVAKSKLGNAQTDKFYLSDAEGNAVTAGTSHYVTIEYAITYANWSFGGNLSPFGWNMATNKNSWKNLSTTTVAIRGNININGTEYNKMGENVSFGEKKVPCLEGWNLDGTYTGDDKTLTYGYYTPEEDANKTGKKPLIVWLHGAGEGGTDPSIAVLGNQVSNLSKPLIQDYFVTDSVSGAYVLAPQTPTMWMDNGDGQQGGSDVGESIYTEALFGLIQNFVTTHSDIDANRVYLGGCSNGGWMTVEMLSKHGEFFAAAYPIAVPFDKTAVLTDAELTRLSNVPMWITHAKADNTVKIVDDGKALAELNSNSLYIEMLKEGATNVHYTLFDTVTVDNVTYDGHWSWIFTLRDECSKVQATTGSGADGAFVLADFKVGTAQTETVNVNGSAATLWGWIAAQSKPAE